MPTVTMTDPPYSIPELATGRLQLRAWRLEEASVMRQLADDREVAATTLSLTHPYPLTAATGFIASHAMSADRGDSLVWALAPRDSDPIGNISLALSLAHERAEIGYWLGRAYWGDGYMTEAARAVVDYAFRVLRLRRVNGHAMARNIASCRVMEKSGMRREGVLRQHIRRWTEFEDIVAYGVLREDWEPCTALHVEGSGMGAAIDDDGKAEAR